MREWICRHYDSIRYGTWITNKVGKQEATQGTLCCWKAMGEDNPLSAYLRSVPFPLVVNYYKRIQNLESGSTLIDISDWKSEEITSPGTWSAMPQPARGGPCGLIQICRNKRSSQSTQR